MWSMFLFLLLYRFIFCDKHKEWLAVWILFKWRSITAKTSGRSSHPLMRISRRTSNAALKVIHFYWWFTIYVKWKLRLGEIMSGDCLYAFLDAVLWLAVAFKQVHSFVSEFWDQAQEPPRGRVRKKYLKWIYLTYEVNFPKWRTHSVTNWGSASIGGMATIWGRTVIWVQGSNGLWGNCNKCVCIWTTQLRYLMNSYCPYFLFEESIYICTVGDDY